MDSSKELMDQVRAIVDNPDRYPTIKPADHTFLERLCQAQKRGGHANLTGRQRNILSKILADIE